MTIPRIVKNCEPLEYTSFIDMSKLQKLRKLTEADFNALNAKYRSEKHEDEDEEHPKNYATIFEEYSKLVSEDGSHTFKEKVKQIGYARVYPDSKHSVVSLPRIYANYLCQDFFNDVDIVNCHPVILKHIVRECVNRGLIEKECPELIEYAENRAEVLEKYKMEKHGFMPVMYNENYSGPVFMNTINTFLKTTLYNALKSDNAKVFEVLEKSKREKNKKDGKKEDYNLKGGALSLYVQTFERIIAYSMDRYFANKGFTKRVMVYDGFYIQKDFKDLNELEKHVLDETGFSITLVFKSTQSPDNFIDDIDKMTKSNVVNEKTVLNNNDSEIAEYIFEQNKHKIINNNGTLYVYHKHNWTEKIKDVFEYWISTSDASIKISDKVFKLVKDLTKSYGYFVKHMIFLCEKLPVQNVLNNETGLLVFNNGYYDFNQMKFIKYNEDTVLYCTMKVNRDYNEFIEKSVYEELENRLYDVFNNNKEEGDNVFAFIARAIAGHVSDKVAMCLKGERNSGKGMIVQLIILAFNGITGTVNSNEFECVKGWDAERSNAFAGVFCEKRIVVSEEVDGKMLFNSKRFKSIVSGGDLMNYRYAYGISKQDRIKALYLMTTNQTPLFDNQECLDTFLMYNTPCKFVPELSDVKDEEGNNIELGYTEKLIDLSIKDKLKTDVYIDAFIHFVISKYTKEKPNYKSLKEQTSQEFADSGALNNIAHELNNAFNNLYQITKNPKDIIKTTDIHDKLKNTGAKAHNIRTYLRSKGIEVDKTIRGVRYYSGLVTRENKEENCLF